MILAWTFLAVSLASATIQGVALVRMLGSGPARSDPVRRGLLRTSVCRVLAALAYVVLAIVSLLNLAAAVAAVATFSAVQLMWIVNGLLDVQLRRRLDPPTLPRLCRAPARPLKEKTLNPKIADLIERVVWTFIQALAGSVAAASSAVALNTFDWRAALIGGGTAAVICAIKVLLSHALNAGAQPAVVDMARNVLLDLIDELLPNAAAEINSVVKAATADLDTPAPAPSPVVMTQSMPAVTPAPAPVVVVTSSSPSPSPTLPAFAQAPPPPPVPSPAPAPAAPAVPPSAADIAALSASQPTP